MRRAPLHLTLPGRPPTKNNQAIASHGKAIVRDGKATAWFRDTIASIFSDLHVLRGEWSTPTRARVWLHGVIYLPRAGDIETSAIQDVLQGRPIKGARGRFRKHVGLVYFDDEQVDRSGPFDKRIDAKNPRVELVVECLTDEPDPEPEQRRLDL